MVLSDWSINPIYSHTIILVTAVVLLLLSIALEVRRTNQKNRTFRIIAVLLSILSLYLLAVRPYHYEDLESRSVLITTEGSNRRMIDSLKVEHKISGSDVFDLSDFAAIPLDNYSEVHVTGTGLETRQLKQIKKDHKAYHYYSTSQREGIIDIIMDRRVWVGQKSVINVSYYSEQNQQVTIVLERPEETDSIEYEFNRGSNAIQLEYTPKLAGEFLYGLQFLGTDDENSDYNTIPVIVNEQIKPKVLIINEFPSFELKYLKNALGNHGYSVAMRVKVGKSNVSTETVNLEEKEFNLKNLSPELINKFDLIVTHASSFYELRNRDLEMIKEEVNNGLGLLLLADSELKSTFPFDKISLKQSDSKDRSIVFEEDKEIQDISTERLVMPTARLFPVLVSNNEVISGYVIKAKGRAGFINLKQLYTLQLRDQVRPYLKILEKTIHQISRRPNSNVWSFHPSFIISGIPVDIRFHEHMSIPEENTIRVIDPLGNETRLNLNPILETEGVWQVQFVPINTGWHRVMLKMDSLVVEKFFVSDQKNWTIFTRNQKMKANHNLAYSLSMDASQENATNTNITRKTDLPLIFPFLIFIISTGYLWLEPKL